MDPQTPTEPPPPAYGLEQEYDRKISQALERSLTISNEAQQQRSSPPSEEDEWEEWDEAIFEAAAALALSREQRQDVEQSKLPISPYSSEKERFAMQNTWRPDHRSGEASSSTSGPVVQQTRKLPACPPAKERPRWYSEAQLDTSNTSGSSQNHQVSSPPRVYRLPPENDDPNEPLPPFAAVGPSLEGPPFDEVVRQPPRLPRASNIDSPPQSPLDSVESDSLPDPPSLSQSARTGHGGHHLPSPRQSLAPPIPHSTRRRPSPTPDSSPLPPPMRFDPSVAYTRHLTASLSPTDAEAEPVNASAFYNSSVSSLFVPSQISKNTTPLRGDTTSSLYSNRSQVTMASTIHHGAPAPNPSYYPIQNQTFLPSPQPPFSHLPPPQQSQVVIPNFYGPQYPGSSSVARTPSPPHWPPRPNNHGGGHVR